MNEFTLTDDQVRGLRDVFIQAGWNAGMVEKLCQPEFARQVREVHEGLRTMGLAPGVVDMDELPYVSEGHRICQTSKLGLARVTPSEDGTLRLNDKLVKLDQNHKQKDASGFTIEQWIREWCGTGRNLAGSIMLNASLFDYLLQHSQVVPSYWCDKIVLFLGTIFEDQSSGVQYVRGLHVGRDGGLAIQRVPITGLLSDNHFAAIANLPEY